MLGFYGFCFLAQILERVFQHQSDFSVAAQERMPELRSRANTLVLNGIHDVEDALKKPKWKDDPRMMEVARSMNVAYNMAKAQAETQ